MTEQETMDKLLASIKASMGKLEALDIQVSEHWGSEDYIYRYYHQSYKVFGIQHLTADIVKVLQSLCPERPLNEIFMQIYAKGTEKQFEMEDNKRWDAATQPLLQAFFHAKYFLDMVIKYGKQLKTAPAMLPSGWAAVLYLYGMR